MRKKVIFIGAGPGSLFGVLNLINEADILVIDKGPDLEGRRPNDKCYQGFGGASLFSDGKVNLESVDKIGGTLSKIVSHAKVKEKIYQVDKILNDFGAPETYFEPSKAFFTRIKRECLGHGLKIIPNKIHHLGSDGCLTVSKNMREFMGGHNVQFAFGCEVYDIEKNNNKFIIRFRNAETGQEFTEHSDYVVASFGRGGSGVFEDIATKRKILKANTINALDVGVRAECSRDIIKHITSEMHEAKFLSYSDKDVRTRSFCMADGGSCSIEKLTHESDDFYVANGYSNSKKELKTDKTNFAILCSLELTKPFSDAFEFAKQLCRINNMLAGKNNVIVQRTVDLFLHRRSNELRLDTLSFKRSLPEAMPGNIEMAMPKVIVDNLMLFMTRMDKIAQGFIEDSLFYSPEIKLFSTVWAVNEYLESMSMPGLYICGDAGGYCRGISHSGASSLIATDRIKQLI